jgi:hypothetical protein
LKLPEKSRTSNRQGAEDAKNLFSFWRARRLGGSISRSFNVIGAYAGRAGDALNARSSPRTALLSAALLSLWLVAPVPAWAQKAKAPWARSQQQRAGLELDLLSKSIAWTEEDVDSEVSTFGLGFALVGQIRLLDHLYLDAEIPFAYGNVSGRLTSAVMDVDEESSTGGFVFGNPTLGAHLTSDLSRTAAAFLGGSLSIPVLHEPAPETRAALQAVTPARAAFDLHRFIPEHLPLRARAGVEVRSGASLFHYRGEVTTMLALPTDGGETEVVIEPSNELELRSKRGLGGGVRLQAALTLTEHDKAQLALEPFASYEPAKTGVYGRIGLLVAIDGPLGFGFDQDKVATLRFAFGGKF